MAGPDQVTIRIQTLGGQWETLGTDRYREVVPEGVAFSFNEFGPDTCSFVLRRDTGATHPDLTTWTPIEVEIAGRIAWDGRLKETPTSDGDDPTISIQAEGWQYHLDDDVYAHNYIHTRLDFTDTRAFPLADLTINLQGYEVSSGDGQLLLGISNGQALVSGTGCSGVIDLGPDCSAITVSMDVASSFNGGSQALYVMGTNSPWWNDSSRLDFLSNLTNNNGTFVSANHTITLNMTIASPRRYLTVLLFNGFTGAAGGDVWFKVTGFRAFADASYQTSGVSTLKADTVIKHALLTTAPLLSTDTSQITAGTFSIPEFSLDGLHSPREVMNAVNAYENYELRVALGRRLYFRPRQSSPIYEIGDWSGADFTDASANSGDDIYNRTIVEGTGPDGAAMSVARGTSGPPWTSTLINVTNPSFETNTADWTVIYGTLTRDTGVFQSGVASGRMTTDLGGNAFITSTVTSGFATGFIPGNSYRLIIYLRRAVSVDGVSVNMLDSTNVIVPGASLALTNADLPLATFTQVALTFVANEASQGIYVTAQSLANPNANILYVDTAAFNLSAVTLVDRRNFRRTKILPVSSSITITSGARIATLFLTAHRTVPFKGGFQVVGLNGMRRVIGGSAVHPAHIQVGQLVRCTNRVDPDSGGWGRDGTIASVAYTHDTLTSTVSLDENRAGLDALLSRLSVVVGSG